MVSLLSGLLCSHRFYRVFASWLGARNSLCIAYTVRLIENRGLVAKRNLVWPVFWLGVGASAMLAMLATAPEWANTRLDNCCCRMLCDCSFSARLDESPFCGRDSPANGYHSFFDSGRRGLV